MTRVLCGRAAYFTPRGELTAEHLLCAMHNLLLHFPLILLTERYSESLALLAKTLGWTKGLEVANEPKNTNGMHQYTIAKLSQTELQAIEGITEFDTLLYQFATCLFERQL